MKVITNFLMCYLELSYEQTKSREVLTIQNKAKKNNLVFRATVLKTLGRVGSVCFVFLRIETSIIKTPTEKKRYFRKKV